MKAGHGRHPQTAGATPRALPSGAGPHPAEDKEPEQEFVPGLVSRQGFVIPALSGMCWALGKFPAGSREQRGSSHLAPGGRCPSSCGMLRARSAAPAPSPSRQPRTGSSRCTRSSPGVSAASLPRGNWGPSSSPFPEVVGQESQPRQRGQPRTSPQERQRPAPLGAQPCQEIWEDFRPFCVFPKRRK